MRYMLRPTLKVEGDLDDLFQNAVEVVVQYDHASASLLQRRLDIGYARAARLLDQLTVAGVVGPPEGAKPRDVLIRSYEDFLAKGGNPPSTEQEEVFEVSAKYKVPRGLKLSRVDRPSWGKQLSEVVNSKGYKSDKSELPILLGYDDDGILHIESLVDLQNLIIVGNPQSRKEILVDTILVTFLLRYSPNDIRLILNDPNHGFDLYDGIPHLLTPVITEFEKGISAFRWTFEEINRRKKLFTSSVVRSIEDFNKLSPENVLPRILLVTICNWIDDESDDLLTLLASTGVRAGVHNIIIINRMSDKNLSADLKANIPSRAVLRVTSGQDSRLAGVKGAENLGLGELLLKAGNLEPKKLSTIFTPEANVIELVEAVKQSANSGRLAPATRKSS